MLTRKMICFVTAIMFVFGQSISAFPADTSRRAVVTLSQAMDIAREKLDIPDNYKPLMSYYNESGDESRVPVWVINYSDGTGRSGHRIETEINALNGSITRVNLGVPEITEPIKYKRSEAQQIAAQFMKKLLTPEEFEQLYLVGNKPSYGEEFYNNILELKYKRMINGYPFCNDGVKVSVDKRLGKVVSYHRVWSDLKDEEKTELLSPTDTDKVFHENVGIELGYVIKSYPNGESDKIQVIPAYYPRISKVFINARNTEIVNEYGGKIYPIGQQEYQPLTTTPATVIAREINMEEAMAKAKTAAKISSNYLLVRNGLMEGQWHFAWEQTDNPRNQIGVSIDRSTGEVMAMHYPWPKAEELPKSGINRKEAQEQAISLIKKFIPGSTHLLGRQKYEHDWISTPNASDSSLYQFYFPMFVNGLPFRERGVSITIKNDGSLVSYEARLGEFNFASLQELLSLKEAKSIFNHRLISNLYYEELRLGNGKLEVVPVYRVGTAYGGINWIDARNGMIGSTVGSLDGYSYEENVMIHQAEGHWAGKNIGSLVSMGVIDYKDGYLDPESHVTRAELVKMLIKAARINPKYPVQPSFTDVPKENIYMGHVEAALANNLVHGNAGKFRPDSKLTREEMAVIIANALEQEEQNNAGKLEFKDSHKISSWAVRGVQIAVNTGLIKGDTRGYFNPKKNLTNGEIAAILKRLIEKNDETR